MMTRVKSKSGMTMASIVLYVALFFIFTVFAISMSTNMNLKALSEKGNVIINEEYQKFEYNLLKSSKNSLSFDIIGEKITFSNNDEYLFDLATNTITKNGGILLRDVTDFKIINVSELSNLPVNYLNNIDKNNKNICLEITIKKYGQEKTFQIFLTLGE
jgi:hypothetical protein